MERPDWRGETVVCIASGPSLTVEDCGAVRASGHRTIVTNTTFRTCPWAHMLFAYDARWWQEYGGEVKASFKGELVSQSNAVGRYGAMSLYGSLWFRNAHNSGACAVSIAVAAMPAKVLMLGFDCRITDGASHHHGDHPAGMSNCASIKKWPGYFAGVERYAQEQGVRVVNVSRQTALTCFERGELETEL